MTSALSRTFTLVVKYGVLIFCSLIFLFPLYLAIINSLGEWYGTPLLIPTSFRWQNYIDATTMLDFWRYSRNAFILTGIVVSTSTLVSGMVGYAFARLYAPGRSFLFLVVLSTMMIPSIVTLIPTYILFYKMGILNTYVPWLLWGLGGGVGGGAAYFIFFYRQFFANVPKELEEAARIDGCSIFRTYWNIFLPMSMPVVATVTIINFQWNWSDIVAPFMFLNESKYPIATALSMFGYTEGNGMVTIQPVAVAAGILVMIPTIITFFIGQKHLVQGIATTGIKG